MHYVYEKWARYGRLDWHSPSVTQFASSANLVRVYVRVCVCVLVRIYVCKWVRYGRLDWHSPSVTQFASSANLVRVHVRVCVCLYVFMYVCMYVSEACA